ncbi:cell wall hydrolase [Bacillus sp. SL00103]
MYQRNGTSQYRMEVFMINESRFCESCEASSERIDRTTKAIYFYNPKTATDNWIRSRKIVERIGRHVFAV